MAEPESILQLGIEAAREGKKEEARQLFRLLTRQEPDNAQGWLWLAGVAENREERQNALERVLAIEPDNEMAFKGLQALGVRPTTEEAPPSESDVPPAAIAAAAGAAAGVAAATPPPPPPPAPLEDPFGEDDPFAELNNLSETIASDTSGPVRRTEPAPELYADEVAASSRPEERATSSSRASSSRRAARVSDEEYETSSRGMSPLLGLLLFLVGLGLIGLLIAFLFPGIFDREQAAAPSETVAASTAEAGLAGTSGSLGEAQPTVDPNAPVPTVDPNAPVPTADPNAPVPTVDPNAPVPTVDPNAPAPTADPNAPAVLPTADLSQANPTIVNANTPLQSQGWIYDFNQPTFAASVIGNIGQYSPTNGRFVVVLAYAINNTGTTQPIPGNFFVMKDAQGRIWEGRPEVSEAYVVPGVNADLAHTQPFPADGITRSVAIIFDVAPDATDLVFFARSNPSQGWLVLRSV